MIIVSDTSPIINLAQIDLLFLIPKLYHRIIIPTAVYEEIVIKGANEPGSNEIKNADWVEVQSCKNVTLLDELNRDLDVGEAEAIILALELKAEKILMDEQIGRQKAIEFKLQPIGVLGILLKAKKENLILSVKPHLDKLINDAHFFVHPKLYSEVLKAAGE